MVTPPTFLPAPKTQGIPFDDPRSACWFLPSRIKPFVATPAALALYGELAIVHCLLTLQEMARKHDGLDYLQVFSDSTKSEPLWFIEDGDGGAITALLPSDF